MTRILRIISGSHIPGPPGNIHIEPKTVLKFFSNGPRRYYIGKTKVYEPSNSPEWNFALEIPLIYAYSIEVYIYHHRFLIPDLLITKGIIDLSLLMPGTAVQVAMNPVKHVQETPVIAIESDLVFSPFRPIRTTSKNSSAAYIYATFDPPLPLQPPTIIPVELRILNCEASGYGVASFGVNSNWSYLGGSTDCQLVPVESGFTQVHRLEGKSIPFTYTCIVICPHYYTGNVTIHFVRSDGERLKNIKKDDYYLAYNKNKIFDVYNKTIQVHQGFPISSSFYIKSDWAGIHYLDCDSMIFSNETVESFEQRVIRSVVPGDFSYIKRFAGPYINEYKFEVPNLVEFRTGANKEDYVLDFRYYLYDERYKKITSWNNRFKGFIQTGSVRTSRNDRNRKRFYDKHYKKFNFEKIPDECCFVTICVISDHKMALGYKNQQFVRLIDGITENEINFYLLYGNRTSRSVFLLGFVRIGGIWYGIPVLKYYDEREAVKVEPIALQLIQTDTRFLS